MILHPSELKRKIFFIVADILIIILSVIMAFNLRFDFNVSAQYMTPMYFTILFLSVVRVSLFYFYNIYDISWRHFGFKDMSKLLSILISTTVLIVVFAYIFRSVDMTFPRSIIPIEFFISLFLILSLRVSKRLYAEFFNLRALGEPTLIIAPAEKASHILKALADQEMLNPKAIIDDKYSNVKINGINVYTLKQFIDLNVKCSVAIVDEAIDIQKIYDTLHKHGIKKIKISSGYSDYGTKLQKISVEDLLARRPKDLDKTAIKNFIVDKKVLITGAGGSIGSEIARQCAAYGARELILLDHSEYNLYQIAEELAQYKPKLVMQSVVNKELLDQTFAAYKPDIVIHAAAYKHVPLVEDNIEEAILNNVIGTKNTIDCAIKHGVEKFVLISTDKAVRPTNVMGTTKRICELYTQNVDSKSTEIVAVRFGNVLGSSGSVIPKFKSQIESGGPVTVTHPDITRYFMLISEACELVLQAASIGKGGEIFILDMGEPIKIIELAKKMIELSDKKDVEIVFNGLRPGEKLYEELLINETDAKTEYDSITVAGTTVYNIEKLSRDIEELTTTGDKLTKLKEIVPEFNHQNGKI